MYGIGPIQCLLHCQVLNYDRRLAPSHPDPPVPEYRSLEFLRKNLHEALCHKEDHFKMVCAMDVLQRKIEEELAGQDFRLSDSVRGVIHVLLVKPKTHTALKVGSSFCPGVLKPASRLRQYKICFAPLEMKKVEAIHLYQSTRKTCLVEPSLHRQLRAKYGNVRPHDVKSTEFYATERLQAILDLLCEIEQQPIHTLILSKGSKQKEKKEWEGQKMI